MKLICNFSPQIVVFYRASPRHKLKIVKVSAPSRLYVIVLRIWPYVLFFNVFFFFFSGFSPYRTSVQLSLWRETVLMTQWLWRQQTSVWLWVRPALMSAKRQQTWSWWTTTFKLSCEHTVSCSFFGLYQTCSDRLCDIWWHLPLFLTLGLPLKKGKGFTTTLRTLSAFSWARELVSYQKWLFFFICMWCARSPDGFCFIVLLWFFFSFSFIFFWWMLTYRGSDVSIQNKNNPKDLTVWFWNILGYSLVKKTHCFN